MNMQNEKIIKSPLNYTGNKYRILDQMKPLFPKNIDVMVDLFCGGATVGLNTNAKKIIFIDSNPRVIGLLVFLSKQNFDDFIVKLEDKISYFGLSFSYKYGYSYYRSKCNNIKDNNGLKDFNSAGYYKLREEYNSLEDKDSDEANLLLYLLMVYAFNNDIRFSSTGQFNLPIGKTDLNKMNVNKLEEYIKRVNSIDCEFFCLDFQSQTVKDIVSTADFVYMDPPYLITDAVYNTGWCNDLEYKLLDFIEYLLKNKVNFALSNVLEKVGKRNEPLYYWCQKNIDKILINDINYNYRSSSYNKINREAKEREIVVINKRYN